MLKPYQFWSKGDHLAYFKGDLVKVKDKWARLRSIAQDIPLSTQAQLRLEWTIFYYTVGGKNATATANHFGVSRKTFHKWHVRFDERNLHTLEDHSKAPKNPRGWEVNFKEEARIIKLRKSRMKYGKKKLKVIYKRKYGETISTWKIERVIRKHQLFPDKLAYQKRIKKKARRAKKSKKLTMT